MDDRASAMLYLNVQTILIIRMRGPCDSWVFDYIAVKSDLYSSNNFSYQYNVLVLSESVQR